MMAPKGGKQKLKDAKDAKVLKDGAAAMPREEVVRMLNDLRDNNSAKCNAEDAWKNQCAKALQVYKGLSNGKKHELLKASRGSERRMLNAS